MNAGLAEVGLDSALHRALLAHEGGWDEALLVLVPLIVIGVLLKIANSRVNAQLSDKTASDNGPSDSPDRSRTD